MTYKQKIEWIGKYLVSWTVADYMGQIVWVDNDGFEHTTEYYHPEMISDSDLFQHTLNKAIKDSKPLLTNK